MKKLVVSLLSVFLYITLPTLASTGWANDSHALPSPKVIKVTPQIYAILAPIELPNKSNQGYMANSAAIIGDKGVILIDTGFSNEIGQMLKKTVAGITDKPVTHIINTHDHGDHILGNNAFKNTTIISSAKCQATMEKSGYEWLGLLEGMTLAVNMFRIETDDEIFYNPTGGPYGFGANENLDGETRRQGVEVKWAYQYKGVIAGANYTRMKAKIYGGLYDGSDVPNVPENRVAANLGYAFDMGLFLGLNGVYMGSRYLISDFNNSAVKQDDYTVVNAKIKYDWRWLTFFVDLNNIFDEEYSSYGGLNFLGEPGYYPSPEFNVLAGVTARYGF